MFIRFDLNQLLWLWFTHLVIRLFLFIYSFICLFIHLLIYLFLHLNIYSRFYYFMIIRLPHILHLFNQLMFFLFLLTSFLILSLFHFFIECFFLLILGLCDPRSLHSSLLSCPHTITNIKSPLQCTFFPSIRHTF